MLQFLDHIVLLAKSLLKNEQSIGKVVPLGLLSNELSLKVSQDRQVGLLIPIRTVLYHLSLQNSIQILLKHGEPGQEVGMDGSLILHNIEGFLHLLQSQHVVERTDQVTNIIELIEHCGLVWD
jgi:hypothetical protein